METGACRVIGVFYPSVFNVTFSCLICTGSLVAEDWIVSTIYRISTRSVAVDSSLSCLESQLDRVGQQELDEGTTEAIWKPADRQPVCSLFSFGGVYGCLPHVSHEPQRVSHAFSPQSHSDALWMARMPPTLPQRGWPDKETCKKADCGQSVGSVAWHALNFMVFF